MLTQIINMYLDQYFRDFIDEVHSVEGDYSYVDSIDGNWVYDPNDEAIDAVGSYTYNINKVIDKFFNQSEYGPLSERYSEMMSNLYALTRYCDPEASYHDTFSRFNETTLVHTGKVASGTYTDKKLFYVEALTYVRTYRDAFKTTGSGGAVIYPDADTITSELGWFVLPAMDSDLPGVADNVRAFGGPNEHMGIINAGSEQNEWAIDFMQYLFSPTGQAAIYSTYVGENNAPVVMRQLVKNVEIPSAIDYSDVLDISGDCTASPYLIFGKGSGLSTIKIGTTNTYVKDQVSNAFSSYFRGSNSDWVGSGYAANVFDAIKGGFVNYAAERNFIYTDYSKVAEATNNLVNSPYNTSN